MTDEWRVSTQRPLDAHAVHVWRVPLDEEARVEAFWPTLSSEEQARANRYHRDEHRRRYVIAHGALRRVLAEYVDAEPRELTFVRGKHGKPSLILPESAAALGSVEFNLSHSDDLALVAVTRGRPVGVDLERWRADVEFLELAERFFSPAERRSLGALAHTPDLVAAGFFAAWTRKEAYLKATGFGIARGLHHFDVSLDPREPARLLADRLDAAATERWSMSELAPASDYSAAVVVEAPMHHVVRLGL